MYLNERNYDQLTYHLHELSPRHLIKTRLSMGRVNSFLSTANVSLTKKDIYSLHPNESATDSVMSLFIHWYVSLFSAFILRIDYRLILIVFIQRVEANMQDQKVSILPIDFLPRLCHATPLTKLIDNLHHKKCHMWTSSVIIMPLHLVNTWSVVVLVNPYNVEEKLHQCMF